MLQYFQVIATKSFCHQDGLNFIFSHIYVSCYSPNSKTIACFIFLNSTWIICPLIAYFFLLNAEILMGNVLVLGIVSREYYPFFHLHVDQTESVWKIRCTPASLKLLCNYNLLCVLNWLSGWVKLANQHYNSIHTYSNSGRSLFYYNGGEIKSLSAWWCRKIVSIRSQEISEETMVYISVGRSKSPVRIPGVKVTEIWDMTAFEVRIISSWGT